MTAATLASAPLDARAATYIKADNANNLTTPASYTANAGSPTSAADFVLFDSNYVNALIGNTGALTLGGFVITSGTSTVNFGASNGVTWNVGDGANTGVQTLIDMSAATRDISINNSNGFFRLTGGSGSTMVFNVAANRTLTMFQKINAQGNNKTLRLDGAGNIVFGATVGSSAQPFGFNVNGATVSLNVANTFNLGSGAFTVTSGQLNLGNDNALGSSAGGTIGNVTWNGGTIAASGGARSIASTVFTLGGNGTLGGTNALTLGGALTQSGSFTLTNSNTTATTTLAGGVNLSNSSTNRTLTVDGAGNTLVSGVVANGSTSAASNLTYAGSGLLVLGNANTFAGMLTISSGAVRLDNASAAQNAIANIGIANGLTFGSTITTATLAGLSGAGNIALANTAASALVLSVGNNDVNSSYGGALGGSGALNKIGAGTLTVTGTNTFTGGTTVSAGTLSLGTNGSVAGAIGLSNGATLNMGAAGSNFPVNALSVVAGATASLTSANLSNAYAGNISSGDASSVLNIGTNVSVNAANTQQFANFSGTVNVTGQLRFSSSTLVSNGGSGTPFVIGTGATLSTRNAGGIALGSLAGSGFLTGASSAGGTNLVTYTAGALGTTTLFSGVTSNGTTGTATALTKVGGGTLTLTGANTYSGTTTISGGRLQLGDGTSGRDGTIANSLNVVNNSSLAYNRFGTSTYAGTISGTGSVTKLGDGMQILTGNNSYAGGTVVGGGTLRADAANALGSGTTDVNSGVLAGTGSTGGTVNVNPGGTITAGTGSTSSDTPGTLTSGNQAWAAGGQFVAKFTNAAAGTGTGNATGGTGTSWDTLSMGRLDLSGLSSTGRFALTAVLKSGGTFAATPGQVFTLATVSSITLPANHSTTDLTDLFALNTDQLGGIYMDESQFSVTRSGGDISLAYQTNAAPEPTTAALFLLGGSSLMGRRRRRGGKARNAAGCRLM